MAASDNLICYYLYSEAAGVTRDNGEGTAALDAVDTGTIDYPLSAVSEMGDGSLLHTIKESQNALSVAEANLPADFPGKASGTGTDYTVYLRIRTQPSISTIGRIYAIHADAFKGWYISQEVTNGDRDVGCVHTDDGNTSHFITLTTPDTTNFHTVVMRYKDGVVTGWLNGVKDGTEHTVTGPKEAATALFLGNSGDAEPRSPDAYQDELAIFARALTDAEIVTLDEAGIWEFLNTVTTVADGLTAIVTPGDVTISRGLGNVDKRGLILAAVEDALATISNSNGYNFTYQKHHRRSMEWDQVPGSMPAILWFPGETQYESLGGVGGGRMARMRITVLGYYKREDPDSDDHSSRILKDIERALLRAQNAEGDTHYLANAGVEWLDWIGTEVDPYYQGEFRMGRVMLDVILNYTEKGSEIIAA